MRIHYTKGVYLIIYTFCAISHLLVLQFVNNGEKCSVTLVATQQGQCVEVSGNVDTHNRGVFVHNGVCVRIKYKVKEAKESRKTDQVTLIFYFDSVKH